MSCIWERLKSDVILNSVIMAETVLVTGGSGLVGRCLADEVLANGDTLQRRFIFLSSKDGDLTRGQEARKIFDMYRPDYVIHLAAKVGGLYANMEDKDVGQFYEINMKLNENVLALSFEFNVKRCVSCLSTCIFPDQIEYPLDETKVHLGPPHASNYGYAMAKRQVDLLNEQYNSRFLEANKTSLFFSIIPTNIYGPHDNFDLQQSHVVPGLVHRAFRECISQRASGQENTPIYLTVHGSGKPMRQFIYGRDLARLILWSLDEFRDALEPRIIMCPGASDIDHGEISIGQVAETICKIFSDKFELDLRPQFDVTKSDGQFRKTATNRKLRRLHPGFQFTDLEWGLGQTIGWFCSNYPHIRGAREHPEDEDARLET